MRFVWQYHVWSRVAVGAARRRRLRLRLPAASSLTLPSSPPAARTRARVAGGRQVLRAPALLRRVPLEGPAGAQQPAVDANATHILQVDEVGPAVRWGGGGVVVDSLLRNRAGQGRAGQGRQARSREVRQATAQALAHIPCADSKMRELLFSLRMHAIPPQWRLACGRQSQSRACPCPPPPCTHRPRFAFLPKVTCSYGGSSSSAFKGTGAGGRVCVDRQRPRHAQQQRRESQPMRHVAATCGSGVDPPWPAPAPVPASLGSSPAEERGRPQQCAQCAQQRHPCQRGEGGGAADQPARKLYHTPPEFPSQCSCRRRWAPR